MARLEDLKKGCRLKGLLSHDPVIIIDIQWHGSSAVELFYKDSAGNTGNQLVYRYSEPGLEIEAPGRRWTFSGDSSVLRLVSEAYRIRLAHLFDPLLAVHTSKVDPLPHQITAVYDEMLPRQPLRFLLADDPGAGKTIMTGLFIKELIARGDLLRCLICCPGKTWPSNGKKNSGNASTWILKSFPTSPSMIPKAATPITNSTWSSLASTT